MKDHFIRYEQVDNHWYNALPLGNGRCGAMVYREGHELHIAMNHYDIYYALLPSSDHIRRVPTERSRQILKDWNEGRIQRDPHGHYTSTLQGGSKQRRPIYQGTTQPYGGEVIITLTGNMENTALVLCMEEGTVTFTREDQTMTIYIPKTEDRVAVVYDPDMVASVRLSLDVQPEDPVPGRRRGDNWIEAYSNALTYRLMLHEDNGWLTASLSRENVQSQEQELAPMPHPSTAEWRAFFAKSSISLPDSFLETVYYMQLYLLEASSGRSGRYSKEACGLNGLWDIRRPTLWGSMWYWDVNIQSSFAAAGVTNHLELLKDFCDAWLEHRPGMRTLAEDLYDVKGLAPDYPHPFYLSIQPWCMQYVCRYYEYSRDEDFLNQYLIPSLQEMTAAMRSRILLDEHNLRIGPDISPEQGPMTENSVITLSTWKYVFEKYVEYGLDTDGSIQNLLRRWPSYEITKDASRYRDSLYSPDDLWLRHPSILMPVWPAEETLSDPERWKETLAWAQDHMEIGMFGFGWLAAAAARLGEGAAAVRLLYDQGIDMSMHSNGIFYEESDRWVNYCVMTKPPLYMPGMMEPSGSLPAAICEMLLQYRDGITYIFPALPTGQDSLLRQRGYRDEWQDHYQTPAHWKDVSFRRLRTPQALISATLQDGKMTFLEVTALVDAQLHLQAPEQQIHWTLKQNETRRYGCAPDEPAASPKSLVQKRTSTHHRRIYLGEDPETEFVKTFDAWMAGYGMGNHLQMPFIPFRALDAGARPDKDYDLLSHRPVSVSEDSLVYYTGWESLEANSFYNGDSGWTEGGDRMERFHGDSENLLLEDGLTGQTAAVYAQRVPAGKYEFFVLCSGDTRLTLQNNGLQGGGVCKNGRYIIEEMAVVMKQEGVIRLQIEAGEEPWRLHALMLRRERSFY